MPKGHKPDTCNCCVCKTQRERKLHKGAVDYTLFNRILARLLVLEDKVDRVERTVNRFTSPRPHR